MKNGVWSFIKSLFTVAPPDNTTQKDTTEQANSDPFVAPTIQQARKILESQKSRLTENDYKLAKELFEQSKTTQEVLDKFFNDIKLYTSIEQSDTFRDVVRIACGPRAKLSEIEQHVQLCRFIKSTDDIAQAAVERWKNAPAQEGQLYKGTTRPLCWTDTEHALTFLRYGDKIAYADLSNASLNKHNIQDQIVMRGGNGGSYREYLVDAVEIKQLLDMRDAKNVARVLLGARDDDLVNLFTNRVDFNNVIQTWTAFGGFKDSIAMLKSIQQTVGDTLYPNIEELREAIASYDKQAQPAMYIEAPIEPEL